MKRAICIVILLLIIFSVVAIIAFCGDDTDKPIDIEKNPPKDDGGNDPGNISGGNDKDNTWNEDGTAVGPPVKLPAGN